MIEHDKTQGILYGVGVGSGDPELMTLKAVRIIRACDVIAVPHRDKNKSVAYQTTLSVVPEIADKDILCIDMPMVKDELALRQAHESGAKKIMNLLDAGKQVAFLTLGDPTIFSTYMYIHQRVKDEGYQTEIVSGISSILSVGAKLGKSLVIGSDELHIIPAVSEADNLADTLKLSGTKVYMKVGGILSELRSLLSEDAQVFFIENCGMEDERVLEGVENLPEKAGYFSILVVFD